MADSLISDFSQFPDLHQNPLFSQSMNDTGWLTLGSPGNFFYFKKIGPLGVAKIQHSNSIDLNWIKKIRRQYHLLLTYVEPGLTQPDLGKFGLKVEPFAISATSLIDLRLSSSQLLKSFKSKTRYNISYTQRKNNLTIIIKEFFQLTPSDHSTFESVYQQWSKQKKVVCYDPKFFKVLFKNFAHSGWIHFAYHQNKCVAVLMILKNNQTAIYYAAFANPLGYSLFAPTLLTWTAIQTAKNSGCQIFDFGGIYDHRYPKMYRHWQGFTKFKEGFSPTVVYYPPTQLLLGW